MVKVLVILLILTANSIIYLAFAYPEKIEFIGRWKQVKLFIISIVYLIVSFKFIASEFAMLSMTFYLFIALLMSYYFFPVLWRTVISISSNKESFEKLGLLIQRVVIPLFVAFITLCQILFLFYVNY